LLTEMTEETNKRKMFYDATCEMCTSGIQRIQPWLRARDVLAVPFENGANEAEMRLEWDGERAFGGADAVIFFTEQFWYGKPLAVLAKTPLLYPKVKAIYERVAANRHCNNGGCRIDLDPPKPKPLVLWGILLAAILTTVAAGMLFVGMAAWVWMWVLAGGLWLGFKAMNFLVAGGGKRVSWRYWLWVGTEAKPFRRAKRAIAVQFPAEALVFMIVGVVAFGLIVPFSGHPLVVGWLGLVAMLSLAHFGSFAVLAYLLQKAGYQVDPIMRAPWLANGLGEFWGQRWNRAFSDWARLHLFLPLVRKWGVAGGTLVGFFASGLAHELVISVPAGGGYGMPTGYFLIQGIGLLAQKQFTLLKNRALTLVWVLAPAPLLFHGPFIRMVFHPMMEFFTNL
ncbi:MAG: MBOAT family protein, partial [Verrucomicrobiota bacterium]